MKTSKNAELIKAHKQKQMLQHEINQMKTEIECLELMGEQSKKEKELCVMKMKKLEKL
jgi:hypothetical protein